MDIPNDLRVILIAEDSPTQAENLRYFLEQQGYQVVAAKNGREALDMMARHKPNLLISDIVMPEMDGYELCHCIRSDQGMKDLPIIFLTVLSDPADIMKSLECGADGFIIKPFKEEPLIERIRLLLASQDLRKHEEKQEPVEVVFHGKKYRVNADRLQIMNLLVSTYEAAVETNSELRKTQRELQDLSAELAAQGEELQVQNEELSTLAEELQKRTAEAEAANRKLKFANRELESFSYSVSHDLKAPIRAIQGFSRMLMGEHAARLDEEGHRLLDVIVNNTQIMTKLIDDLLALSQVGRHQLRRSQVDLAALARQVFKRLREQEPEREIQLTVKDLPQVWGDPALINQIMMNLLGNAIKYTRTKENAAIEVGCNTQGSEDIFYIKDNGVGFEARYADKLFGVFQRLHGGEEYEGTGVGLAIVKHIVQRHGGRVWAAGKPDEGAIFYFTLPKAGG